jgi:hypothetical protein
MIKWFAANNLLLKPEKNNNKIHNKEFITYYISYWLQRKVYRRHCKYKNLGLQTVNNLNWKNHMELKIPKLTGAYYAIWLMVHIRNINKLKSIYYEHFHSIIKYEIIFGGNSSNSGKLFTLQKKIIRIMADAQARTSYSSLFK